MRLGNLTSGHPFKAAWRVLVVFLLCYAVAGYLLVTAVKDTLKAELAAQTRAESLLLQDIYQRDGRAGLLDALQKMKQGGGAARTHGRVAGQRRAQPRRADFERTGFLSASCSAMSGN